MNVKYGSSNSSGHKMLNTFEEMKNVVEDFEKEP